MAALALLWVLLQSEPLAEARRHAERGDVEQAIAVLSQARETASSPELLAYLAQLQVANDEIPQASATLASALELAPRQARLRATLGALYFRLGRLAEAEDALRQSLLVDEENPIAHYYLAAVLRGSGRLDEARAHVRRSLSLLPKEPTFDPNDFSPRVNALYLGAELDLAEGDVEEVERALSEVLAAEPSHSGAHYLLAQTLLRTNRLDEARKELELFRAAKQAQEHLDLGLNYSRHAREAGAARAELTLALAAFADHPRALFFLAVELARSGGGAEAIAMLERLVAIRPEAADLVAPMIARMGR